MPKWLVTRHLIDSIEVEAETEQAAKELVRDLTGNQAGDCADETWEFEVASA